MGNSSSTTIATSTCPTSADAGSLRNSALSTITEDAALRHLSGNIGVTESQRSRISSNESGSIISSGGEGAAIMSSSLHSNLMRTLRNRDPHKIYEIVKFLGEGSMGSVAKVRKRPDAIGGSARPEFVEKSNSEKCCFPVFAFCLPGATNRKGKRALHESIFWTVSTKKSQSPNNEKHKSDEADESLHSAWSWDSYNNNNNSSSRSATPTAITRKQLTHRTSSLLSHGSHKDVFYALKSIHLDRCSNSEFQQELKNEVAILKELDHPNIGRAIETFEYKGRLFIALELCDGGDLYTRDPYTEADANRIVGCLCSAVAYLHSKGIIHRDLKFENVMFENNSVDADIKIIDFGLSKKFAANELLKDAVGTVYTMSPELLKGVYTSKADVWSIGVLAFMLLSSSMPFYGKDRNHVIKKIARGKYRMTSRRWNNISDRAIAFVSALLEMDPNKRPSADEALRLPWLKRKYDSGGELAEVDIMDSLAASIQAFATYGTLKKLGLMVVAYKSTGAEVSFLRRMFKKFDTSADGEISKEEFAEAMAAYSYTDDEIDTLYRGIDIDGTQKVHYVEFLASTLEALGPVEEERLAEAFDRIDSDDTGFITIEDLRNFLGNDVPREYLEKIINQADSSHDRRVSYEEFLDLYVEDTQMGLKEIVQRRREANMSTASTSSVTSSVDDLDEFADELGDMTDIEKEAEKRFKTENRAENFFALRRELSLRGGVSV